MKKSRATRARDKDVEDCHVCGAQLWQECQDKRGRRKKPCQILDLCRRCMAQREECQCGKEGEHPKTGWIYDDKREYKQADLFSLEALTPKGGGL